MVKIETSSINIKDQKIFVQVTSFNKQKLIYFSDNSLRFDNLTCALNGTDDVLLKDVIDNSQEEVSPILNNLSRYYCKKLALPVFISFNFTLRSEGDYFLFIKQAKECLNKLLEIN